MGLRLTWIFISGKEIIRIILKLDYTVFFLRKEFPTMSHLEPCTIETVL